MDNPKKMIPGTSVRIYPFCDKRMDNEKWVDGAYIGPAAYRGWHTVEVDGVRREIPSRRIRKGR